MTCTITLPSLEQTKQLAHKVAAFSNKGDIIELHGDLGAGKTAFARFFINYFLNDEEVTSPTFNLVQTYPTPHCTLWHFDLYRLESENELIEIGLDEALDEGISLIEWPQIAQSVLPHEKLMISLVAKPDEKRVATLLGTGKWQDFSDIIRKNYE